jgi:hypothetical protein
MRATKTEPGHRLPVVSPLVGLVLVRLTEGVNRQVGADTAG